jgi:hypothetical protein
MGEFAMAGARGLSRRSNATDERLAMSINRIAIALVLANLIAIAASALDGHHRGNVAYRFEERQAITLLSATQLAATSLLAALVYVLRTRLLRARSGLRGTAAFWVISAAGFLYLMLDEGFQIHEGMDTGIFRLFGSKHDPMIDGAATALYGVAAAAVIYFYRPEIMRYRETIVFFGLGGAFLALTSVLNLGEQSQAQIAVEESAKLLGVAFFLLGHLAAFFGAVRDVETQLAAPIRSDGPIDRDGLSTATPPDRDRAEVPHPVDLERQGRSLG